MTSAAMVRLASSDFWKVPPVYYRITDSTQIAKVNMKLLLSHSNTKMELTLYLAQKSMEYAVQNGRHLVV